MKPALREFRKPWLWLGIWWFGWALCIVLSLIHPPGLPLDIPDGDKLGHFLAYATLSAWSVLLFRTGNARITAALSLVMLGIVLEIGQGYLTQDRLMDARDALANGLGVLAGQMLAFSGWQDLLQRVESRWVRS